jgi:SagB-type dehydrogenase family enzyme
LQEVIVKQTGIRSLVVLLLFFAGYGSFSRAIADGDVIDLPKPVPTKMSLDDSIKKRRTTRGFDEKKKVTLQELSNILYAMQGHTDGKKRAVPSARGVYPLELYVVTNNVTGLDDGLYKMDIPEFKLGTVKKGDLRKELSGAAMRQIWIQKAQLKIIVTCVWDRLGGGDMAKIFGAFEAGGASQNAYLMAAALKLNVVPVGGMDPEKVAKFLDIKYKEESPVIINCIGR